MAFIASCCKDWTRGSMNLRILIIIVFMSSVTVCHTESNDAVYSRILRDIHYADVYKDTVFDVYYPKAVNAVHPTHIFIHGGGWTGGKKEPFPNAQYIFSNLAGHGFIGISLDYRKVHSSNNTFIPACASDCADAMWHIASNSRELGVDLSNMVVWGESAGAHLALLCAIMPASLFSRGAEMAPPFRFKSVVAWYPPTDMVNYEQISVEKNGKRRLLSDRMGKTLSEDISRYEFVSPLHQLTDGCPPVFLFHGDADKTVNMEHSLRFSKKAAARGVPCVFTVVPTQGHGFKQNPAVAEERTVLDETIADILKSISMNVPY